VKIFKQALWKLKFAKHIKRRLGLSIVDSFLCANANLEMIGFDTEEDPVFCAEEEYLAWNQE